MIKAFKKIIFNNRYLKGNGFFIAKIKKITGVTPKETHLYKEAFTHSSYKKKSENYQRLEYLGDAILGAIIADYLYENYPKESEGYLTQMRSKIVSRKNLNAIGQKMDLSQLLISNLKKENITPNIYGDLIESLIGAVYLDKGFKYTQKFVLKSILGKKIDLKDLKQRIPSYKSFILEWSQKHKTNLKFETSKENNASAELIFVSKVYLNKKLLSKGRDTSKKKAEEVAAKRAYYKLIKK